MSDTLVIDDPAHAVVKKRPGRPKGSKISRTIQREPIREAVREPTRVRHKDVGGRFHIAPDLLARLPGRSVEWKKHTVLGQPDPAYELDLRRKGWEPVSTHQMPGLMPQGYKGPILRDGLMLYERPQELTDEARAEEFQDATDRIRTTEKRMGVAGPGEMTRDHPLAQPRISKTYEPLRR